MLKNLLLAASLLTCTAAGALAATLAVGDPAPPLTIDTWVKGKPVPELKKGRAYIVEFWATWCGPCRQSIPHLTEVQKKYPLDRLTIIGISSSERKGLADVTPFVEKMGDQMNYTVAFDRQGATNAAWMQAAEQQGIPTAFVVDRTGRIAWIGHPVFPKGELDRVVEQVVAGTYNVDLAVRNQKRIKDAQERLQKAGAASDTAGVIDALDSLMAVDVSRRDEYAVKKFEILLFVAKRYEAGYAWGARLIDDIFKDRPEILTAIAMAIVEGPGLERRDLDLAERGALRAHELSGGDEAGTFDTLARVHFARGAVDKAIEMQTKAVELAQEGKQKTEMKSRLEKYQGSRG